MTLSGETCVTFMPIKAANGGWTCASGLMTKFIWGSPRTALASVDALIAEHCTDRHPRRGHGGGAKVNAPKLDRLLARLRYDAHVRLHRLPTIRVKLLRLVVGHRRGEDDFFALFPVCGRRDAMLGGELQRVDDAQHFIEIPARA